MANAKIGMKTAYQPYCVKNSTTCLPDANPPPKCVVNQTKATASEAGMNELFFNLETLPVFAIDNLHCQDCFRPGQLGDIESPIDNLSRREVFLSLD